MGLLDDWFPKLLTDSGSNNQTGSDGTNALPPLESLLGVPMQMATPQRVMPTALTNATDVDMPNVVPAPPWQTNQPDHFGLRPFPIGVNSPHYRPEFDVMRRGKERPRFFPTQDEADQIANLKDNGANTSFHDAPPMSDENINYLKNLSRSVQIDPKTMFKIMAMESGGNPNAISTSGAIGDYQIINATAEGLGVKDRFDPDQNIRGGVILAKQNVDALNKAKLEPSEENIYMMHQLGQPVGLEVIKAKRDGTPLSKLSKAATDAMSLNYASDSGTVSEYIDRNMQHLNDQYDKVFGKTLNFQ